MYTRFRNISYVMAYAVATIPLWYYVTDDRIILLMTLVIGFAYVNVVLSSVDAAQGILTSEKAKTPMPRWLPDKPKYQKWWAIKQRTLRWHLLLIPAKLGLALAFVEWLKAGTSDTTSSILRPYYYNNGLQPLYPQWETLLTGAVVIVLFSLLESGLLAALTLLTTHPSRLVVLRLLIALSVLGIMSQIQTSIPYRRYMYCTIDMSYRCDTWHQARWYKILVIETTETGFFTLNDMGILLAANILRPLDYTYGNRCCRGDGTWYPDNRPFVARQLVAALLGVLVYMATIFTVLRFVRDSDFIAEM
jgi:hypothetical protein